MTSCITITKIRALEGAVVNALEILQEHNPAFRNISTYMRLSHPQLLEEAGQRMRPRNLKSIGLGVWCRRSSGRRFIRAFAFGPSRITGFDEQNAATQTQSTKAWRLADVTGRDITDKSLAFRTKIRKKGARILDRAWTTSTGLRTG